MNPGTVAIRTIAPAAQMVGKSTFSKFGPALEREVRKETPVENPGMRKMIEALEHWAMPGIRTPDFSYESAVAALQGVSCSAEELETFLEMLPQYQSIPKFSERIGRFLSALVNMGSDEEYTIKANRCANPIDQLGHENTKNIVIEGNIGGYLATYMNSGKITVFGNVESLFPHGGEVIVHGDVVSEICAFEQAKIRISGNAKTVEVRGKETKVTVEGDVRGQIYGYRQEVQSNREGMFPAVKNRLAKRTMSGTVIVNGELYSWHRMSTKIDYSTRMRYISEAPYWQGDPESLTVYHKGKLIFGRELE